MPFTSIIDFRRSAISDFSPFSHIFNVRMAAAIHRRPVTFPTFSTIFIAMIALIWTIRIGVSIIVVATIIFCISAVIMIADVSCRNRGGSRRWTMMVSLVIVFIIVPSLGAAVVGRRSVVIKRCTLLFIDEIWTTARFCRRRMRRF